MGAEDTDGIVSYQEPAGDNFQDTGLAGQLVTQTNDLGELGDLAGDVIGRFRGE